jgi:hypothetical protein
MWYELSGEDVVFINLGLGVLVVAGCLLLIYYLRGIPTRPKAKRKPVVGSTELMPPPKKGGELVAQSRSRNLEQAEPRKPAVSATLEWAGEVSSRQAGQITTEFVSQRERETALLKAETEVEKAWDEYEEQLRQRERHKQDEEDEQELRPVRNLATAYELMAGIAQNYLTTAELTKRIDDLRRSAKGAGEPEDPQAKEARQWESEVGKEVRMEVVYHELLKKYEEQFRDNAELLRIHLDAAQRVYERKLAR